ncbi:uncharacterized protein LOC143437343 [Arvicanthis niloticus]|uniref:uncharacterized protein LOC143437343 n=1 Tax=Arvicanthis niloticus TaxID=61156 RepID=UPI00403CCFD3
MTIQACTGTANLQNGTRENLPPCLIGSIDYSSLISTDYRLSRLLTVIVIPSPIDRAEAAAGNHGVDCRCLQETLSPAVTSRPARRCRREPLVLWRRRRGAERVPIAGCDVTESATGSAGAALFLSRRVRGEPDRKSPRGSPGTGSSAASPGGRAPPPFRRRSPALPGSGSASQRPSAAAGETGCGVWRGEGCGAADGRGGRGLAKVKERAINPEPGRHPDRVSYIITLESLVVDPPLQQPTWDDCQQLLQVLLTSEERQSVFQEARKQITCRRYRLSRRRFGNSLQVPTKSRRTN